VVRDKDDMCTTLEPQGGQRLSHFTKILNVGNKFSEETPDRVRQRPLCPGMTELPTEEEVYNVVGKLRISKADDASEILPEIVKEAC